MTKQKSPKPKVITLKIKTPAAQEGMDAFTQGKPKGDNPYRLMKSSCLAEWLAWNIGHDYAYLMNVENGLMANGYPRAPKSFLTQFDDADHKV